MNSIATQFNKYNFGWGILLVNGSYPGFMSITLGAIEFIPYSLIWYYHEY